jgi:hypothetical protein
MAFFGVPRGRGRRDSGNPGEEINRNMRKNLHLPQQVNQSIN